MVGGSGVLAQLISSIDKVAPTNSRIMISGPPGSGKDLVARLIHEQSGRATGPFVVVNAAAIDPERVESELFGEEFGDGKAPKIGLFEQAVALAPDDPALLAGYAMACARGWFFGIAGTGQRAAEIAERLMMLEADVPGAAWRLPEHFHLTLRFIGEVHRDHIDMKPYPALAAHAARCEALPAFQQISQPFQPPA